MERDRAITLFKMSEEEDKKSKPALTEAPGDCADCDDIEQPPLHLEQTFDSYSEEEDEMKAQLSGSSSSSTTRSPTVLTGSSSTDDPKAVLESHNSNRKQQDDEETRFSLDDNVESSLAATSCANIRQ
jgi:hypothetical protein